MTGTRRVTPATCSPSRAWLCPRRRWASTWCTTTPPSRLSLKAHPIAFFREDLAAPRRHHQRRSIGTSKLAGRRVRVAGLVLVRQRPGTAKGVIFLTLEDETGIVNIVVWPKVFENNRRTVMTAQFLEVRGRIEREGLVIHVVAERADRPQRRAARLGDGTAGMPRPTRRCAKAPGSRKEPRFPLIGRPSLIASLARLHFPLDHRAKLCWKAHRGVSLPRAGDAYAGGKHHGRAYHHLHRRPARARRRRVPRMFYDYADSGSWTESTYRANESRLPEDQAAPARRGRTWTTAALAPR